MDFKDWSRSGPFSCMRGHGGLTGTEPCMGHMRLARGLHGGLILTLGVYPSHQKFLGGLVVARRQGKEKSSDLWIPILRRRCSLFRLQALSFIGLRFLFHQSSKRTDSLLRSLFIFSGLSDHTAIDRARINAGGECEHLIY